MRPSTLRASRLRRPSKSTARTPTGAPAEAAVPISNGKRGASTTRSGVATPWPPAPASVPCLAISSPRHRLGFNCCVDMDNVDRWVGVVDNAELDGERRDDTERVFVLWGSQPHSSKAAHGGHGLVDARSNLGVKSVVVDPYLTAEAAKADVWLPVRPGSDCALMLCVDPLHHRPEGLRRALRASTGPICRSSSTPTRAWPTGPRRFGPTT